MASRLFNAFTDAIDWFSKAGGFGVDSVGNAAVKLVISNDGSAAQAHNRLVTVAGSTNPADIGHATWAEAEGVISVRFKVTGQTAGDVLRVVFDASPVDDTTDDTQASNWLTAASAAEATDVEYFEITQGSTFTAAAGGGAGEWSDWFEFGAPLRRVDILAVTQDAAYSVFIEAR